MKPTVSIIMPVHNSSKYICDTINSITNQEFTNYELICVDDGSTDSTLRILYKFASSDPRIIVLNNPVTGAGGSRNLGLNKASGEWVIFLDSDDIFEPQLLGMLLKKSLSTNSDITICNYRKYYEVNTVYSGPCLNLSIYKDGTSLAANGTDAFLRMSTEPWNKLYKRSFLIANNLQFQNTRHANDLFFVISSFIEAKSVSYVSECLINYRVGTKNNTQSKKDSFPLEILIPLTALVNRYDEKSIFNECDLIINVFIRHIRSNLDSYKDNNSRKLLWNSIHNSSELCNLLSSNNCILNKYDLALINCLVKYNYCDFEKFMKPVHMVIRLIKINTILNRQITITSFIVSLFN